MISLETARRLKSAGVRWSPVLNDFFAVPDRGMDERIFVISDMLATLERLSGREVVAFQGASEWALDNLVVSEVVWLPREDQLRALLESALIESGGARFRLDGGLGGYTCTLSAAGQPAFKARSAEEAYAAALLHLLNSLDPE